MKPFSFSDLLAAEEIMMSKPVARAVCHLVALLLIAFVPSETSAETKRLKFGEFGEFEAKIPDGWRVDQGEQYTAILVQPAEENRMIMVLEPLPALGTPEEVASTAERLLAHKKQQLEPIAEDPLELTDVRGDHARVRYYAVIDKAVSVSSLQNAKYADDGVVEIGPVLAVFNLLVNEKDAPECAAAIDFLKSLRFVPPD